jgi:hypothetical protein
VRAYKDPIFSEGFCSAEFDDAALVIAGQVHDAPLSRPSQRQRGAIRGSFR